MSDVENAYKQIASFLNNETEKTLLICGIADEEKHRTLLKTLNAQGRSKGLIFLIHTTMDGMEDFVSDLIQPAARPAPRCPRSR